MQKTCDRQRLNEYLHRYQIDAIFNEQVKPHLALYSFESGERILSQGEQSDFLYILVKGKVKVYTTSLEGKTLILSFKTPLEVIGDIEYVQEIATLNTVEAVSPVIMIGVQRKTIKQLSKDDPMFLQFLLEIITKKFQIKSNAMSFNLLHPVEVRLASYLLSVTHDENQDFLNKTVSTSSLTDTANLIGTSYRHLNRVIQRLAMEGIIERTKAGILIKDRERLMMLTGESIYEEQ